MADIVVKIVGTKLALTYCIVPEYTGKLIKEKLHNSFLIPVSRQTLTILPTEEELTDDRSLADFGYGHGNSVDLRLEVEDQGSLPIYVNLMSEQCNWTITVKCSESTTVGQLKNMVASELDWTDGNLGGMELEEGVNSQTMGDDNATILDYLVVDGSTVEIVFNDRLPDNGVVAQEED
ncbi:hypothetical protein LINPERHAP2_LOCUS30284 [Linum perenne]